MDKDIVVFYHDQCIDGMASAAVAYRHFGDCAEYIPVRHGFPPPPNDGKEVYILDFCFDAGTMEQIASAAKRLVVLDHHKTAEADMQELKRKYENSEKVFIRFDMNKSGAGLAADYFNIKDMPLVAYVEDRDLWRFALPHSKTVNAFIHTIPRDLKTYVVTLQNTPIELAKALGAGAESYLDMYVDEVSKTARRVSFAGYEGIPCVNASFVGISELVGQLAEHAPFALGWYQTAEGFYNFSLRSRGDDGVDVSKIAKQFGGGGHRGAAGFRLNEKPDWL